MSINYHAFQNRGVLFYECEAVYEQWHQAFSHYDPERIERILHLKADEHYLYIPYWGDQYRLTLQNGMLEKQTMERQIAGGQTAKKQTAEKQTQRRVPDIGDGAGKSQEPVWSDKLYVNEAMVIYHLLKYTKDHPVLSGEWTPNESLIGVVACNRGVPDPLLAPFAKKWTGNTEGLKLACEKLGARRLDKGDASYEFLPFPFMPLQLIFWDEDEDFPAQANVMVDRHITDYIHLETTGCVISDLLERIDGTRYEDRIPWMH